LVLPSVLNPAFGQADLSNCEREQIQLAGSIQPHGVLILIRDSDQVVVQASANAGAFFGRAGSIVGIRLDGLCCELASRVRAHADLPPQAIPVAIRSRIGEHRLECDCLLHRPAGGGMIIELERAGDRIDVTRQIETALKTVSSALSLRALAEATAEIFKDLTGYDRVMVYRFDKDGHGEVFSERRRPDLEAFLGNRYPASDIPQIARRLYERNRVRLLGDVEYTPVPLVPRMSPITGQDLDMSFCFLRSMSPIHIQYLKNMGVAGTLVASLMVGGRLWGLVACHHYQPRLIQYELRATCELLAEAIGIRIAALEGFLRAQASLSVRRVEQRLVESIARDGDWRVALFDSPNALLDPLAASGAALLFEGQIQTAGEVPGTQELRDLGRWLDELPPAPVKMTASLGIDQPDFSGIAAVASGVLAVPLSAAGGEFMMWFRPERVRTVTWAGNPFKPVVIGDDPSDLSPRRSFAHWHQLVEGTAEAWSDADLAVARQIGDVLSDVVQQVRSVRTLIVRDQLDQVSTQLRLSERPVVVADPAGRILVTNESFDRLLPSAHPHLESIEDIAALFAESAKARQQLRELLAVRQPWRGEVHLKDRQGQVRPLMLRADPVFSNPERVLGFVLLFTDLAERKAAAAARRRFQEKTLEQHRTAAGVLDSKTNLVYRNLMTFVVENAQLAALEIADGMDLVRMPDMLENVQTSVGRSVLLLQHLIEHGIQAPDDEA
jgi:light-regulated signal transduction histidine kinase (bacteriophytochrome)